MLKKHPLALRVLILLSFVSIAFLVQFGVLVSHASAAIRQPSIDQVDCDQVDPNSPHITFYFRGFDDPTFDDSMKICLQGLGYYDLDRLVWTDPDSGRQYLWGENISAVDSAAEGFLYDANYSHSMRFDNTTFIRNLTTKPRGDATWNDRVRYVLITGTGQDQSSAGLNSQNRLYVLLYVFRKCNRLVA